MASPEPGDGWRVDADGVRIREHSDARRVARLAAAIAGVVIVAAVAAIIVLRNLPRHQPETITRAPAAAAGAPDDGGHQTPRAAKSATSRPADAPARRDDARDEKPVARVRAPGEKSEPFNPANPPFDLGQPGERKGLRVFPPPGTNPVKGGVIVPDDFVLPPGFVRHYQTTDDGESLPAILMFHPDHQPVDATGRPVPMPPDRVVPPALAPPGLRIQVLDTLRARRVPYVVVGVLGFFLPPTDPVGQFLRTHYEPLDDGTPAGRLILRRRE